MAIVVKDKANFQTMGPDYVDEHPGVLGSYAGVPVLVHPPPP